MKDDKFLIGILGGIILLIVVAVVTVLLRSPANEEYVSDDTPAGVVQNYFLAIQRKDYEKAHGYLSDDLKSKPDLDQFVQDISYSSDSQVALQIGETRMGDVQTQVDVSITTYSTGDIFFDRGSYSSKDTVFLRATGEGGTWKITGFPYPYWGYYWNQEQD